MQFFSTLFWEAFYRGYALRSNTFWSVVEGAKLGFEVIRGNRADKGGIDGKALRLNLLTYYDF